MSEPPVRHLPPPRHGLTPKQQGQLVDMADAIARWVAHFTKKYRNLLEPEDVGQLVNQAAGQAVRTWRVECNVPVAMYVWKHVSGTVTDAATKQVKHRNLLRAVRAAAEKCMNNQRDEGDGLKDTEETLALRAHSLSDRTVAAMVFSMAAESSVRDATAGEDGFAVRDMQAKVRHLASTHLTEREQTILQRHYVEEAEFTVIAEALEIGYSSGRRFHNEALTTLGERLRAMTIHTSEGDEEPDPDPKSG